MGQINIKIGDYVVSEKNYDSFAKVVKLCCDGVYAKQEESEELIFIPCTAIILSFEEDEISKCKRCGRLVYDSDYCDACYGDLFGGKTNV